MKNVVDFESKCSNAEECLYNRLNDQLKENIIQEIANDYKSLVLEKFGDCVEEGIFTEERYQEFKKNVDKYDDSLKKLSASMFDDFLKYNCNC